MAPDIAGAAKAADHLIAYQQDAIFAADRLNLRPIIGGRNDDAARALYRFADESRDIFGANFQDFRFNGFGASRAEIFDAHIAPFIIPIRLAHMFDTGQRQDAGRGEALTMHRLHSAHADPRQRRSVIGVVPADENGPARLALDLPIMAHQPQDGVVGFRARAVEKDVRQAAARQAGDFVGQHNCGGICGFEEAVIIRQLAHLFGGDIGQFIAAIAGIDAPKPGHTVEDPVAVAIMDIATLGMGDNPAAAQIFDLLPVGLGGQMMGDVEAL